MKKKRKKGTSKKNGFLEKYNQRETKGNIQNTLLKGTVDTLAGSALGTGIGAVTGSKAPLAGIALILAGHYLGDESGVLRLTGASAMAYGIGKAKEYKDNPKMDSAAGRLGELKQDLLGTFFRRWEEEKKEQKTTSEFISLEESKVNSAKENHVVSNKLGELISDLGEQAENKNRFDSGKTIQVEVEDEEDDDYSFGDEFDGIDLTLI